VSDAMDQIKHTADDMKEKGEETGSDDSNDGNVDVERHTEHSETKVEKPGDDAKDALGS